MYHGYGVAHEQFVWDARVYVRRRGFTFAIRTDASCDSSEPGVVNAFSTLFGTEKLLSSYDGINFTLPSSSLKPAGRWPHIDQNPRKKGLVCAQGVINFTPSGENDGGLIVMKGSHKLVEEFFATFPHVVGRKTWGPGDWFGFEEDEVKWFADRGCETVKVCTEPGDLIIWDSRTVHFNCVPDSNQLRSAICE